MVTHSFSTSRLIDHLLCIVETEALLPRSSWSGGTISGLLSWHVLDLQTQRQVRLGPWPAVPTAQQGGVQMASAVFNNIHLLGLLNLNRIWGGVSLDGKKYFKSSFYNL